MNWRSWPGCTCCRFVDLFLNVNQCSISLQGVVAYHLGRDREARLQLEKVSTELQLLAVDEMDLVEIVSMGYSMAEARTGLRAALGDRKEEKQRDNKRARRESEDREAYGRIKEGISEHEEDHLDLDLVEEGQLLKQYLGLLQHIKI